jgi:hypothetical protein
MVKTTNISSFYVTKITYLRKKEMKKIEIYD